MARNNFISWKLSRRPFRFTVARRVYQFRGKSPPSRRRPKAAPRRYRPFRRNPGLEKKTISREVQSRPPPLSHSTKLPLLSFPHHRYARIWYRGGNSQDQFAGELVNYDYCENWESRQDLNLRYKLVERCDTYSLKITGGNWS